MITQKITVTALDIKMGTWRCAYHCPVAMAIKRRFLDQRVIVSRTEIGVGMEHVSLPNKAIRFIERFDAGKTVKPFSFVLKLKKKP
jgi:hypothetical protein